MQHVLNVLFTEQEQQELAEQLKSLIRKTLTERAAPPAPIVAPVEVVKKKRKKVVHSPEMIEKMRARMADLRERRMQKRAALGLTTKVRTIHVSDTDKKILQAMLDGSHWPSEIGRVIGSAAGILRMTNACNALAMKGLCVAVKPGYFDITESGKKQLEEKPMNTEETLVTNAMTDTEDEEPESDDEEKEDDESEEESEDDGGDSDDGE